MYIPARFAETDTGKLHDLIERYSFATLISTNSGEPFASHLPLVLDRTAGSKGQLLGHMARANPQWQGLDGQCVLAIFHGPHAYVSPTWYESNNVVPTWNYVAVHVYGQLRLREELDQLRELVRRAVDKYEAGRPNPWMVESQSPEFMDGMLGAIVGFEIEIDRIEGKWKLNQNHNAERRNRVIHALRSVGDPDSTRIAELMGEIE